MKRSSLLLLIGLFLLLFCIAQASAAVYSWHTFYGTNSDSGSGTNIAVDRSGNIYVVGKSNAGWGSPIHAYSGNTDIVVLKLDSGGAYQWHTFFGSSSSDEGCGIAVDSNSNIYIVGHSSATWGSPSTLHNGGMDIVVLKLDSDGAYQWHAFYGSNGHEYGRYIALDTSGNIYVTGYGYKTWGNPIHAYSGSGTSDILVLKLNNSGAYQWHTFYGSTGTDYSWGIAIDGSGNSYITGQSFGAWGDSPVNPYTGPTGTANAFVLKLNSSGAYLWNTFYPALWGWAIAVDGSSKVYVTGRSDSSWGSPIHPHSGGSDVYALKLNSSGVYQWNTFYGATNTNDAFGITADDYGDVLITGTSDAGWGSPLNAYSGGMDIFILKLNGSGAYQWNTFYGSDVSGKNDTGWGIARDDFGNVHVTGQSWAPWGLPINPHSGSTSNLFVLKLAPYTCPSTPAMIEQTATAYPSVQSAYNAASSGWSILIQALEVSETLNLAHEIDVKLSGGYECGSMPDRAGKSAINGSIAISGGSVTVENIIIN